MKEHDNKAQRRHKRKRMKIQRDREIYAVCHPIQRNHQYSEQSSVLIAVCSEDAAVRITKNGQRRTRDEIIITISTVIFPDSTLVQCYYRLRSVLLFGAPQLISTRFGSVTARHFSSGCQPNFAALNRGRHLCSPGLPSRWALAHILVLWSFVTISVKACSHGRDELYY